MTETHQELSAHDVGAGPALATGPDAGDITGGIGEDTAEDTAEDAPAWPAVEPATEYIWDQLVRDLADHVVDNPRCTTPGDIRFDLSAHDGPWFDQHLCEVAS